MRAIASTRGTTRTKLITEAMLFLSGMAAAMPFGAVFRAGAECGWSFVFLVATETRMCTECNLTEEIKGDTTAYDACDWFGSWDKLNETSGMPLGATSSAVRSVTGVLNPSLPMRRGCGSNSN